MDSCPFCECVGQGKWLFETAIAFALLDSFPVSKGHALVLPKRHVASLFDLQDPEFAHMVALLGRVRSYVETRFRPDGFNVGVNIGEAAGQTIPHAHIHVIPRFAGDVPDPRGGVRHVIPSRARYWEP